MKRILATAVAVLLGCTACTSAHHDGGSPSTRNAMTSAEPRSAVGSDSGAAPGTIAVSTGSGNDSAFCELARTVGHANLGVSTGTLAPDSTTLLRQVDHLDAIAPAGLKRDFDVFTRFEHSVLDPGSVRPAAVGGDTTSALEHVSRYFTDVCRIT